MIVSNRARTWVSSMATEGYLWSAVLVLASARTLRKVGLISPDGIRTAISWSQYLVQKGMRIWRQEWKTLRSRQKGR
jgi:hypothetical protein